VQLCTIPGDTNEANKAGRSLGIEIERRPQDERQPHALAAELAIANDGLLPFGKRIWTRGGEGRSGHEEAASPVRRRARTSCRRVVQARGRGTASDTNKWMAAARNDLERVAVPQPSERYSWRVNGCIRRRLQWESGDQFQSSFSGAWRILIALTDGNAAVVEKARIACPDDPDVWLASLWSAHGIKAWAFGWTRK